ncbi:MAG TPA: hypothetical protein VEA41_22585 [Salinarimonas sp.]|nr:hypothetical protein [Salinarimonas sp.]
MTHYKRDIDKTGHWSDGIDELGDAEFANVDEYLRSKGQEYLRSMGYSSKEEFLNDVLPDDDTDEKPKMYGGTGTGSGSTGYGGRQSYTYTDKDGKQHTVWYGTQCTHEGWDTVVEVGDVTFGGAAGKDIPRTTDAVLIVDCAGSARRFDRTGGQFPDKYAPLARHLVGIPRIELPWDDMGPPPVTREFFAELPGLVGKGHVIVNCYGGHGRTGTALAALMLVHNPGMKAREAIEHIRNLHCEHAVESISQVQWLCDLAGHGEVAVEKGSKEKGKP